MSERKIVISQVKSAIGRHKSHKNCLIGLGVRRINQKVSVRVTPENMGMVRKVAYMLRIEEV